jgi:Dyp-type peroxidase family protein
MPCHRGPANNGDNWRTFGEIVVMHEELFLQRVVNSVTARQTSMLGQTSRSSIRLSVLGELLAADVPGAEPEPVYDARQRGRIQGNIIPGFNKDHQHFLFYRIRSRRAAKRWLRWIAPLIASMEEVLSFVRMHRALRFRLGLREPPLCATWVNIAFSNRAIAKLVGAADAAAFGDQSFRQGLAARSTYFGDPTGNSHPGNRRRWVVGGRARRKRTFWSSLPPITRPN